MTNLLSKILRTPATPPPEAVEEEVVPYVPWSTADAGGVPSEADQRREGARALLHAVPPAEPSLSREDALARTATFHQNLAFGGR